MISKTEKRLLSEVEKKIDIITDYRQVRHRNHVIAVLLYALVGVTWVAFSDKIANGMFSGDQLLMVSTYKGWLFVGATALCLFAYMSHMVKSTKPDRSDVS